MLKLSQNRAFFWVLVSVLLSQLILMMIVPLSDPTESRYANIARMMAESGDWITPYFDRGIPFWGKPPLSFWAQALSFKMFGIYEISARLPSWMMLLAEIILIGVYCKKTGLVRVGLLPVLIFSTSLVVYVAGGAVLTDPFLTFGLTLAMVSFLIGWQDQTKQSATWFYLFFLGISFGLLAKGPIALILTLGPVTLWIAYQNAWRAVLRRVPWITGILIICIVVLPWYVMAEMKTPGFLEYFIFGEHFYRFIEAGWEGDLYGAAHQQTRGKIWWYWFLATFPWSLIVFINITQAVYKRKIGQFIQDYKSISNGSYLCSWAVFPMLFFSAAGNILMTYVLPALPAFAILMGVYLTERWKPDQIKWCFPLVCSVVPMTVIIFGTYMIANHYDYKTEKRLVQAFLKRADINSTLVFINHLPFSAQFYSQGKAQQQPTDKIIHAASDQLPDYLAIPKKLDGQLRSIMSTKIDTLYKSRRFVLYRIIKSEPQDQR